MHWRLSIEQESKKVSIFSSPVLSLILIYKHKHFCSLKNKFMKLNVTSELPDARRWITWARWVIFRAISYLETRNYRTKGKWKKIFHTKCFVHSIIAVVFYNNRSLQHAWASRFSSDRKLNVERNIINYFAYNNNKALWGLLLSRK